MTAARFVEFLAFILVPIAAIRALWWSDLLFAKPWARSRPEGMAALDLGPFEALTAPLPALAFTLAAALGVGMILSLLLPLLRAAFLPGVQLLALAAAALILALHPSQGFAAYWMMAGFCLVALNLMAAFLLRMSP